MRSIATGAATLAAGVLIGALGIVAVTAATQPEAPQITQEQRDQYDPFGYLDDGVMTKDEADELWDKAMNGGK